MLLTGQTRSSLHLAPGGNVCDGGKLCFSISLILLWLTVSFCFRLIGLHTQRSKDQLGILNVIFGMKLFGKPVASQNSVTPRFILLGGQRLHLQSLKHNIFLRFPNKGAIVLCAINRTRCRERFSPIVLHPSVRVNSCMSPPGTEIVLKSITAKNITVNNVL